jgi:hypothetical protein
VWKPGLNLFGSACHEGSSDFSGDGMIIEFRIMRIDHYPIISGPIAGLWRKSKEMEKEQL